MNLTTAHVLERIPRAESSSFQVDGSAPQQALHPQNRGDIQSVLQVAAAEGWRIVPWGGGTFIQFGAPITGLETVVITDRLDQMVEINEENLSVTVEAGVRWEDLRERLRQTGCGYEVPLDPPCPGRATVGGVLSVGFSGPRSVLHGGVRNLVLGLVVLTAQGRRASFGGKTVKNVAGLDLCKVYLGSLGTLGILLEATLRLKPLPSARSTILACGDHEGLWELIELVRNSSIYPSGLGWIPPGFWTTANLPPADERATLAIGLEGSHLGLEERWRRLKALSKTVDLKRLDPDASAQFWEKVCDLPLSVRESGSPLSLRATVPPTHSREVAEHFRDKDASFYMVHVGAGEAWAHWNLDEDETDPFNLTRELREAIRALGGRLIVIRAPEQWKHRLDVWGFDPPLRALMGSLKRQLDPDGILAPGRLI